MKKFIIFLLFIIFIPNISAITLNTKSLVAMDINSNRVFYETNIDDKRLIASTTKIMTAVLAIEANKLELLVKAGEEVLPIYGSNIYIEYGESMLLLDLIYGLMLRSGNDTAAVIASFVGGSEENFVNMMNSKAKEIGMDNTIFENPHGLDDTTKNYSTAKDLAILYAYAYKNTKFREIVSTKNYKTSTERKAYSWKNRTDIIFTYDKSTGGKTGYTPDAGKVLVSSASNKDLDIVIASFNSIYDYDLQKNIFEEIFNNYKNILLLDKENLVIDNSPYEDILYIKESFYYPLDKNEENNITRKIDIKEEKNYKDGEIVGEILIYLDEELLGKREIFINKTKESIWDKTKTFFSKFLAIFN